MDPFLLRTLELARIPGAAVETNPRVGALLVHQGRIIGEGHYRGFGGPHAEVNAVAAVQNASLLPQSTLYVSLEPCNYHGKTPACTGLILDRRIPRVVIGSLDPNPRMAGQSVDLLREAGVEVHVNPDPAPFHEINAHFWVNHLEQRPFVSLKWAESPDGFMAGIGADGMPRAAAISGPYASRWVHWLRHEHQAILVGRRTALLDDPLLDTRKWPGHSPLRIVLDRNLSLPRSLQVFRDDRVLLVNGQRDGMADGIRYFRPEHAASWSDPALLFRELYVRGGVGSILVEGGAEVHRWLLEARVFDRIYRNVGVEPLGTGLGAPQLPGGLYLEEQLEMGSEGVLVYRKA